ncbi:MAG: hypothetical protein H6506_01530 [Calditrichaeota bacterium]|nr:hypothetical protein [Calditrichota bacterium]MCB9391312.1 hypothetical protein [Calditrichota bacterium]
MSNMRNILLFTALVILAVVGCDRYVDKDADPNQAPHVRFVNFPEDSSQFSYAPVIHWTGWDDDGEILGFELYDIASDEGIAAYRGGDATWQTYLAGIPDTWWVYTESASAQIYLMTEVGEVTEHIFLVRSVDNANSRSGIAWRTFFRTNERPNTPKMRWALESDPTYFEEYTIEDTLLVGDTLTATYTGIQILWQGSDPDSRIGNVIQLGYSYALVKLPNDTVALPVYDDSNHVAGYRAGWSDWTVNAQIALSGLETGDYTFFLRSIDDGFAISDTAELHFTAIKPTFARRIMIVDENKVPSAIELQRGGVNADTLLAFYKGPDGVSGVVAEAVDLANQLIPYVNIPGQPEIEPFVYDDIFWYDNRLGNSIPYELISQFDLVWIIDDDNTSPRNDDPDVINYVKVLGNYLDVGGSVWMTGRRLFNKSMSIPTGGAPVDFLSHYFNLFTVRSRDVYSGSVAPTLVGLADFQGAVASDVQYPDLETDTVFTTQLRYGPTDVVYPPEIETFGRSAVQQSFDFSTTIYNYKSTTSDTSIVSNTVENFDCNVDTLSDSTVVVLIPQNESLPLLAATRIHNVTRGVDADFIQVRNLSANQFLPRWRIFASIPASAGEWENSDVLEVSYVFIPLSSEHDEPVATNFVKYSGNIEIEITENGFITRIQATPRFRTSLFCFPLVYMKNQPFQHPLLGEVPSVSMLIANQILYFNQNLDVNFNFN